MKKLIIIFAVILISFSLVGCSKKKEQTPFYYGKWEVTGLRSTDGAYTDDAMQTVYEQTKEENRLFCFEFAEKSYMYGTDSDGNGYTIQIAIDLDQNRIITKDDYQLSFKWEDEKMVLDLDDKFAAILEKTE